MSTTHTIVSQPLQITEHIFQDKLTRTKIINMEINYWRGQLGLHYLGKLFHVSEEEKAKGLLTVSMFFSSNKEDRRVYVDIRGHQDRLADLMCKTITMNPYRVHQKPFVGAIGALQACEYMARIFFDLSKPKE